MILKLIAGPLIGMIIGYFTNWLAVKCSSAPAGRNTSQADVSFTPGVIPRGKERIAESMRDIINDQLLTEEAVKQHLASRRSPAHTPGGKGICERPFSDSRTWKQYLSVSLVKNALKKFPGRAKIS